MIQRLRRTRPGSRTQSTRRLPGRRRRGVRGPALQPGRKFALSTSFGNFQGSNALGLGATALLHETSSYALTVNAGAGWGMNINSLGTRAAVTMQW
ncbi:MAG: YadA-like family protein [Bradyrhizobium sp.]